MTAFSCATRAALLDRNADATRLRATAALRPSGMQKAA
jgi:hypothetical protein